jgi:hypothetical protein
MKRLINSLYEWVFSDSPLAAGIKVLSLVAVLTAFLIYLVARMDENVLSGPCSPPNGNPIRCYHVSQHICEVMWAKTEPECKEFVTSLKLPPGRLVGPIIFRCQVIKLDQAFSASRKSTPECLDMHRELEEWKKRNGFE